MATRRQTHGTRTHAHLAQFYACSPAHLNVSPGRTPPPAGLGKAKKHPGSDDGNGANCLPGSGDHDPSLQQAAALFLSVLVNRVCAVARLKRHGTA